MELLCRVRPAKQAITVHRAIASRGRAGKGPSLSRSQECARNRGNQDKTGSEPGPLKRSGARCRLKIESYLVLENTPNVVVVASNSRMAVPVHLEVDGKRLPRKLQRLVKLVLRMQT